jgi:hypothetical protein
MKREPENILTGGHTMGTYPAMKGEANPTGGKIDLTGAKKIEGPVPDEYAGRDATVNRAAFTGRKESGRRTSGR